MIMIQNRELTVDDYLAMFRRRAKIILIPALLAPLAGFLISYAFTPKYMSQSLILVEGQKVPENMVQPVVSQDLTARVATLQQQVLSQSRLQPVVERLYPGKSSQEVGEIVDTIRQNMAVEPVVTDLSQIGGKKKPGAQGSPVPGFTVNYTASKPRAAQQICTELTTLLLDENLKSMQAAASGTSDVLSKGLEDAKHNLEELDANLAAFKKQYVGQLPGDEESNLKILMGMNSQLEAQTQALNRDQQDKAYTESVLAQQVAAWKSTQSSTNPQTLEKQLSDLQSQLLSLQARYTGDHPDVIKTKADIDEVKKKLAEINKASEDATDTNSKASATEPPEIRQLRSQVHQLSDSIAARSLEQKRLQREIAKLQNSVSLSPQVEEQYKGLTRDYENAQKSYQDLLAKKSTADLTVKMTNQSEGERMFNLNPANLPDSPSFPNRWLFAGGGLGAGFALGLGLALWLELRDQSIRTEADAEAALELPMLASVPWVGALAPEEGDGKFKFWNRHKSPDELKDTVGV
jgi:polysaccharide chain length determinant protein (PEP-CTERM system associated)